MTIRNPDAVESSTQSCCAPELQNAGETQQSTTTWPISDKKKHQYNNLISINGGWFQMGAHDGPHPEDGEGPVRNVFVSDFLLSPTCVTNEEFAAFVNATNYKTSAEQVGHSFVFHLFDKTERADVLQAGHAPWWHLVTGAYWQAPEGCGSTYNDRAHHPVTHISHADAQAYCHWANVRLPTEAEWEYAARGGLAAKPYPWGDQLTPGNMHHANLWQGEFPNTNSSADGFIGTAPVNAFDANAFGLYNVIGNVWEWTNDRHSRLHSPRSVKNPSGPLNGDKFVAKGGSYLCHESYCYRYRTSSRQGLAPQTSTGNIGFRVASDNYSSDQSRSRFCHT